MNAKERGESPIADSKECLTPDRDPQWGDKCAIQRALLAGNECGDPLYRTAFAQILAASLIDDAGSFTDWLGLPPKSASTLFSTYFPKFPFLSSLPPIVDQAPEEADLRALLLSFRAKGDQEEEWLAMIIARRSLAKRHLWQDLGLDHRDYLNALLEKAFPLLFKANVNNMRWKNFFYRALCEKEGLSPCKAPMCDECPDVEACFEPGKKED